MFLFGGKEGRRELSFFVVLFSKCEKFSAIYKFPTDNSCIPER